MTWPGDWLAVIQNKSQWSGGMVLIAAWQDVSKASVAEIIDAIRNRVLEFCLRLEKEVPELMSDNDDDSALPTDAEVAANQVFNQVIVFGSHVGNIANASAGARQVAPVVKVNDIAGLADALNKIGVPADEVEQLSNAIRKEIAGSGKIGDPCGEWFKRAKQAVASGTWSLAEGATVSTIRGAILSYLGLG